MVGRHVALAAAMTLMVASSALAQQAGSQQPSQDSSLDVRKLPINLDRVQRQLQRETTVREERDGLNLRYVVDVYGAAPRIELFTPGENLRFGPVPGAAPTHREMIDLVTPREYRAPAADLGAFMRWLNDRKKSKD